MAKFQKLVRKPEGKGKPAAKAAAVKYGKKGMEAKAAAGKKKC